MQYSALNYSQVYHAFTLPLLCSNGRNQCSSSIFNLNLAVTHQTSLMYSMVMSDLVKFEFKFLLHFLYFLG